MTEPTPENGNKPVSTEVLQQNANLEKDPYAGIFFEIDVLMKQAKAGCVEMLRPLTTLQPEENELFACIEVYQNQDFSFIYNKFLKTQEGIDTELGESSESAIPGLAEHLESFIRGKVASIEAEQDLTDKLRKRLLDFFSQAWKEAGGLDAKVPTYFSFEEEYEYIDLTTREVFTEEELSAKLG